MFYRGILEDINRLDDLGKIRDKINNEFVFYEMNLGDKVLPVNKKYDMVYISNISDYIPHNIKAFEIYRDNLNSLIRDDGTILSVNLRKLGCGENDIEKEVFSFFFDVEELPEIERYDFKIPAGKIYRKK